MIQTSCLGKKRLQSHHFIHAQFAFLFLNLSILHTNVYSCVCILLYFLRWLSKESTCQCKRHWFDAWVGKIPGERNGNPLQYSCMGNPMDRETWQATVHGVAKSQPWLKHLSRQSLPTLGNAETGVRKGLLSKKHLYYVHSFSSCAVRYKDRVSCKNDDPCNAVAEYLFTCCQQSFGIQINTNLYL